MPATEIPLSTRLIDRLEAILLEAEAENRPLEMPPFREQLFELFVTADGAGFLREDAEEDLSADGICQKLGSRWGLASAARSSVEGQIKLPPEHLSRMRLLWSVMRMWMEWDYAWSRYDEFRGGERLGPSGDA